MRNEALLADQGRTIFRTPHRRGAYWLSKRRDGRSQAWMITWYDGPARTVRYRSTRVVELASAKVLLDAYAAEVPAPMGATRMRSIARFVYFIGGDVGAVKIGSTSDPVARLTSLQCGSPIPLRILASRLGNVTAERAYHKQFAAHRLHGEWFARCPEIEAEIARLVTLPAILPPGKGAAA